MKFPSDCLTPADRAGYCEIVKRKLIAEHSATADPAEKHRIEMALRIVGYWGSRAREGAGVASDETIQNAFKESAKKSEKWKADTDVDYYRDRGATQG